FGSLLYVRLQPIRHIAGERLEQAGRLRERRLEPAGEAREQLITRRYVGEGLDVFGRELARPEQPALEHQVLVGAGEVAQRVGRGYRVAAVLADERDCDRAVERIDEIFEPDIFRGPLGQRVLEDLVVGARGTQRGAQLRDLVDGDPAVLGENGGLGA